MDWGSLLATVIASGGISLVLRFTDKSKGKTKTTDKSKKIDKSRSDSSFNPSIKVKGDNAKIAVINVPLQNGKIVPAAQPLVEELQKALDRDEIDYVASKAVDELSTFQEYEKQAGNKKMIRTLANVLPDRDMALIKTGFYKRYLTDQNKQAELRKLVSSLTNITPAERNLVNLASSDHIQHYIYPAYNQLKTLDNGRELFLKHYYDIISGPELALFVHGGMSIERIVKSVIEMAERNLRYGVVRHKIYVHATGASNVDALNTAYEQIKQLFPETKRRLIEKHLPILIIKIPYQNNNLGSSDKD